VGLTKRLLEEELERGWRSIGKDICEQCVINARLRQIVEDNLDADECDYCGRAGEAIAADTDHLMTHIGDSFQTEYADPAEELPYA
jgi:Zn ribbon nucleic-acid-binding protein